MDLFEKLQILSDSAKYDVSCSSSGSERANEGGLGNGHLAGICHTWSADGRCVSLLKVLFTNYCIYDCKYCVNRKSNDVKRASFTPEELCELAINFYRRNYIEGLFVSSAVIKSPNYTMELLIKTAKLLRQKYKFFGYIHMKAIPGADPRLVHKAGLYADRISVNIELPSKDSLKALAPDKNIEGIVKPMRYIKETINDTKALKKTVKSTPAFVPAGQTTQMIVGATKDSDLRIISLAEKLYENYSLKRVYYSAYIPVNNYSDLPSIETKPPLLREHRLYQADWLLRYYKFKADEILDINNPELDTELDPKCSWAIRNLDKFPVEINKASFETLIRVPGIGVTSAHKIIKARRLGEIDFEHLKKIRVVLKRAQYFITCKGRYYGDVSFEHNKIRNRLVLKEEPTKYKQISFFENLSGANNNG